jgi:D-sedoheptulose 7-phosphate isomerase
MIVDYLEAAKATIDAIPIVVVERIVAAIRKTMESEGVVYTMGNGGSAATASHFVNDLVSLGIRAVALTDNVPTIMAIANDFSFDEVFKQQLEVLKGYFGDTVIAFSCSGDSENVVRAIKYANEHNKTTTIGFCGDPGSRLNTHATISVCVPGGVQHQEDAHLMLCHAIYCRLKELQ